jgi:RES domain-containing protein
MGYASSSRALAVLEFLVHARRERYPADRILIPIEIPDEQVVKPNGLPSDWKTASDHARLFGDRWVRSNSSLAVFVPSAVLTKENNVLINPAHPEFVRIRLRQPETNFLDARLFH